MINVSRGSQRDRRLDPLVVSVPFNDAVDLDHNGEIVRLPCEAANAICVAGAGPRGS